MDKNIIFCRLFSTSIKVCKNLKGKSQSSQHWLMRQLKDPYVEKAKMLNYRCRSAFKLIEIDNKCCFLKPGNIVLDCGAAPGSWSQVAVERINADMNKKNKAKGTIIAIDRQQIYPLENVHILDNSDFTQLETQEKVQTILNGRLADVVMSDMAPNATGIKDMDQENIIHLCYTVFRFALQVSSVNATLLVKLWQGIGAKQLEDDLIRFYRNVKVIKPASSRSDSAEIFLIAREFKGVKKKDNT